MKTKRAWRAMRFTDGRYGVLCTILGALRYDNGAAGGSPVASAAKNYTLAAAQARADELNGTITPGMPIERFNALTSHVPMQDKTRHALRNMLVDRLTWSAAAEANGITQSGIKRALDRVRLLNEGA